MLGGGFIYPSINILCGTCDKGSCSIKLKIHLIDVNDADMWTLGYVSQKNNENNLNTHFSQGHHCILLSMP